MLDHCSKFFFFAIALQLVTIPLLVSSQSSVEAGYSLELSKPITRNVLELQKDGEIQAAFGFTSRSMTWAALYSLSAYLVAQPNDEKAQVITPATVVWRATEKLVHQGAYLNFTEDGNLELSDRDGSLVWSTGTAGSGAQILALEAPGNLVLRTRNGTLVWQSFDHPTDALFPQQQLKPGMKLVASVSSENTQEGYFSLEVDRFSVVLYSASPVYGELWSSGSSKVEISHVLLSDSSLKIYGQNGTVLWSSQAFSPVTDATGFQLLKIYPMGELRLLTGQSRTKEMIILNPSFKEKSLPPTCGTNWLPKNTGCSCPELKNGNNSMQYVSSGDKGRCKIDKEPAECRGGLKYDPSEYQMQEAKDFYYYAPANLSSGGIHNITREACKTLCINNCTCKASLSHGDTSTCFQMADIDTLYRTPNAANSSFVVAFKSHSHSKVALGTFNGFRKAPSRRIRPVIVVAAVVLPAIIIVTFAVVIWRRILHSYLDEFRQSFPSGAVEVPRVFTYPELHEATKGFSKKIGSGGFGSVYEGVLPDGSRVAVKRLENSNQGRKQFKVEVKVIGSIHHKNLVRLKGFCSQRSCYFLVYEYVANGSLDRWIFKAKAAEAALDWDTRFRVVEDIARGLAYLHEECSTKVLHLDIKPQNILLDENFGVKIADFGLSRMVEQGEMSTVMTMIRGTPGYMAPEWLQLRVSDKLDVYSFGIVALEVATGLQALHTCVSCETSPRFLAAWGYTKLRAGEMVEMVDAKLRKEIYESTSRRSQAERLLKIGMWCIQPDPRQRPRMVEVVKMLEGATPVMDPPVPPPDQACKKGTSDTSLPLNILMDMINQGARKPKEARGCIPRL